MYEYYAQLESVTDGDTVRLLIDHGMYIRSSHPIRLAYVHAPELNTPEGKQARLHVGDWFITHGTGHDPQLWPYVVVTEKDRRTFNRYIGVISCRSCGAVLNDDINIWMAHHR